MKKLVLSLVSLFLFFVGYCYDLPQSNNTAVNDFSNVIKSSSDLSSFITDANKRSGADIVVVSISKIPDGVPIDDYARNLSDFWRIGSVNKNGILILFSLGDRKSRIVIGKNLSNIITNDIATDAAKQMNPYFKQGDFDGGVKAAINFLADNIVSYNTLNSTPQANVPRGTTEKESSGHPFLYGLLLLFVCTGIYFLYVSYKEKQAEKIANYKKIIEGRIELLNKYIQKLNRCLPNDNVLPPTKAGYKVSDLLISLQKHIDYFNLLNIGKDRNYTESQYNYFDKIDMKSIENDVELFVSNNNTYSNNCYKTNQDYINKIDEQIRSANLWHISSVKGEFLDSDVVVKFEENVDFYKKEINNVVIDKTNFAALQKAVDTLENCVKYFKKNAVDVLAERLEDGKEKTSFINTVRNNFYLLLDLKDNMTSEKWCSLSTKNAVRAAISNYKHRFEVITISYTNSSYRVLNSIFRELKNDSVFNLLDTEKAEYDREERRKVEEALAEERRKRNSYSRSSSHTTVVRGGGYRSGYGGGYGSTIIIDNSSSDYGSSSYDSGSSDSGSSGGSDWSSSDSSSSSYDSGSSDSGSSGGSDW